MYESLIKCAIPPDSSLARWRAFKVSWPPPWRNATKSWIWQSPLCTLTPPPGAIQNFRWAVPRLSFFLWTRGPHAHVGAGSGIHLYSMCTHTCSSAITSLHHIRLQVHTIAHMQKLKSRSHTSTYGHDHLLEYVYFWFGRLSDCAVSMFRCSFSPLALVFLRAKDGQGEPCGLLSGVLMRLACHSFAFFGLFR